MNYKISLTKIKKIINPFTDGIDKKDIKNLLESGDIFALESDSPGIKLNKSIAYEVANYKEKEISINLPANMNFDNVEQLVTNGLMNLYAAIYLGKEYIVADVNGNDKVAKTLLGIDLNNPDNIDLPKVTPPKVFQWEIDESMLQNTWGDKEFVLNKFDDINSDEFDLLKETITLVEPALWKDIDFIQELSQRHEYILRYLPLDIINTETIFQLIKNNPKQFDILWHNDLQDLFDKFYPLQDKKESYNQYGEKQDGEEPLFIVEKVKAEIFTNPVLLSEIFKSKSSGHSEIYDRCTIDVQLDKLLVKTIYESKGYAYSIYIEPHKYLTPELKNDYPFLKEFIQDNIKGLKFKEIEPKQGKYYYENGLENLYTSWIEDKNKVIEMLESIDHTSIANIYNILEKNLQKDEQLIALFMDKNPEVYHWLPEAKQSQYFMQYIEKSKFLKNISDELILTIKDKEVLKELIKRGEFTWLANSKCPVEYKKDWALLSLVADYRPLLDDKKILATLMANEEIMPKLMQNNSHLYSMLPATKRHDINIAKIVLSQDKWVDNVVFNNKDFCIFALQKDKKHMSKIPNGYWNDQEFVLEVFKNIDEGKIKTETITMMPKEVSHLLTVFDVQYEYANFLNKYFLNMNLNKEIENKPTTIKKLKI